MGPLLLRRRKAPRWIELEHQRAPLGWIGGDDAEDVLDGAEEVGCAEAMAEGAECHDHLCLRPRGSASQRGQPRHDPDPPPPPPS